MRIAKVPRDDRCRDRTGEIMSEDETRNKVNESHHEHSQKLKFRVQKLEGMWT